MMASMAVCDRCHTSYFYMTGSFSRKSAWIELCSVCAAIEDMEIKEEERKARAKAKEDE